MKILKITSQYRRDFKAVFLCEHCEHKHSANGYDDGYFHKTVIPNMVCPSCGKKADKNYRPLATKYPDGQQV